jgi:DNA-binding transcriptional ArsR family regulator
MLHPELIVNLHTWQGSGKQPRLDILSSTHILYLTDRLSTEMAHEIMTGDDLSLIFRALADPTRRAILERLTAGEASVSELAEPFEMSLPAISRHLKVLERAGLITRGRDAQWRPCRLEVEPLKDVDAWMSPYRQFWEESFDRLDVYLQELQGKGPDDDSRQ